MAPATPFLNLTMPQAPAPQGVVYGFSANALGTEKTSLGWKEDPPPPQVLLARRLWLEQFGQDAVLGEQVHGGEVLVADASHAGRGVNDRKSAVPGVDGLITTTPGLVLSVTTADCLPVLLAHRGGGAVAALHCGWRSLQKNLIETSLSALAALGAPADELLAWLGPCISQSVYEVSGDFAGFFDASSLAPSPTPGRWLFDLKQEAVLRLTRAGVPAACVHTLARCTFSEAEYFFSNRRDGGVKGLMLSSIALG